MNNWRLLVTSAFSGPMNMAIDHAIMESVAAGRAGPTLRFYAWEPPCLSLGYMQPLTDVDEARLAAQGWDLVRRITGGRAVLHIDELTYSVALRADDPIAAGGIVESYRRISDALLRGLQLLGADANADTHVKRGRNTGPVCFEVPSHYEVTVDGKKLVGSAQVRKLGAVLQHGSLPLYGDIARICDALAFETEGQRAAVRQRTARRATTLETALGQIIPWKQAVETLAAAFRQSFDLALEPAALTPDENARAHELCAGQYATPQWQARF